MEDELFRQNYELNILSGIVNRGQLERWVPGFCNPNTDLEHRQRYDWVSQFVGGQSVLDIACGVGAGSKILALAGAQKVIGADISEETIRYAQIKNSLPQITFKVADAETFKFDEQFDLIVSFETVEHLKNVEVYLKSVASALKPSGQLIISTPISRTDYNLKPANTYHVQEWGFKNFQILIADYFEIKEIFLQLYYPSQLSFWQKIYLKLKKCFNRDLLIEKWNNNRLPERLIQKYGNGYQILICRKKI